MNKTSAEKKRQKEKQTVLLMIKLYCTKKHHFEKENSSEDSLCEECNALKEYVFQRIEKCPFTETKTFCSVCKIHCYKKDMRQKIRKIMKFSGPRMLLINPFLAIKHVIETMKVLR